MPSPCGPSNTVCLTVATATKVRDTLAVVPLLRKENKHLRTAVSNYKHAADTAHAAYVAQVSASFNTQNALANQRIETTRARLDAKQWKGKARRRGWVNWLLAALAAAAGGAAVAR